MKTCLLVIDYQNDFIDGALGFEGADRLATGIKKLIDSFHQQGFDVIFTLDTHTNEYLDTQEGKNLPVKHCILGTNGHQIYPLVNHVRGEHDVMFYKNTFGSLDLANFLHQKDYHEIVIVGLVTNICVISNAVMAKAALPEAKIIIYKNLVASFDEQLHEKTLEVMQSLQMDIQEYKL
jgi:nicotinamidase-related amidase